MMKTEARPLVLLLALALLNLGATFGNSPRLTLAAGEVLIQSVNETDWNRAQGGELLSAGAAVRTGADGRAEIRLSSGTVRVYPNSILRLPDDVDAREVEQGDGKSIFDILSTPKKDDFKVKTPEAVVMVKGTRFSVDVDAGVEVSVYEGLVGIIGAHAGADIEPVMIREGFTAVSGEGQDFDLRFDETPDPWSDWEKGDTAEAEDESDESMDLARSPSDDARALARESVMLELDGFVANAGPADSLAQSALSERMEKAGLESGVEVQAEFDAGSAASIDPATSDGGGAAASTFPLGPFDYGSGTAGATVFLISEAGQNHFWILTNGNLLDVAAGNDTFSNLGVATGDAATLESRVLANGITQADFIQALKDAQGL